MLRRCARLAITVEPLISGSKLTSLAKFHNSPKLTYSSGELANEVPSEEGENDVTEAIGYAYNDVIKKKGLYKPKHTLEEQIAYMKSKAYAEAYKGLPVFHFYRRNIKGQEVFMPRPRMFCISKDGKYNVNHACPICRDEYLFFDFRNPSLISQFLMHGTDQLMPIKRTGLCIDQYTQLQAQYLKAKEHGYIKFAVPFMNYDYKRWYPSWNKEDHEFVTREAKIHDVYKQPLVKFPAHNRDFGNDWDQWWIRHDEFAKRTK